MFTGCQPVMNAGAPSGSAGCGIVTSLLGPVGAGYAGEGFWPGHRMTAWCQELTTVIPGQIFDFLAQLPHVDAQVLDIGNATRHLAYDELVGLAFMPAC